MRRDVPTSSVASGAGARGEARRRRPRVLRRRTLSWTLRTGTVGTWTVGTWTLRTWTGTGTGTGTWTQSTGGSWTPRRARTHRTVPSLSLSLPRAVRVPHLIHRVHPADVLGRPWCPRGSRRVHRRRPGPWTRLPTIRRRPRTRNRPIDRPVLGLLVQDQRTHSGRVPHLRTGLVDALVGEIFARLLDGLLLHGRGDDPQFDKYFPHLAWKAVQLVGTGAETQILSSFELSICTCFAQTFHEIPF